MKVLKRDGTLEDFNLDKVRSAVTKAYEAKSRTPDDEVLRELGHIPNLHSGASTISVEALQDKVEKILMDLAPYDVARAYILYREKHKESRFIRERIEYMERYVNSEDNAATSSETDPNANVTQKNVANLEGEVYKEQNRVIQRQRMKDKLNELFPEVAKQYEEDLEHHIIYTHDEASSPTLKQYCMAVSLYPLMLEGVGNIDGVTPSEPNDLQSFSGQITNLTFLLSSQCKGAVAFGEYFIALNYYIIKEFGPKWYEKLDYITSTEHCLQKRTIRDNIYKAFKQFLYGVNQPAGNRSFQSPFTNISYYDHTYFESMFKDFCYPDGTKPKWEAIDTLQRMFMKYFNKLRTKQILTFPVETLAMVHDGKDIIDKDYKQFAAEMYAEGHSFFTYISDSADSLASCCFSKDTKVVWKSSTTGVHCTTLEELHNTKWGLDKKNLRIMHNGSWITGKSIKLSVRPMYRVTTLNNKEFYMTDNHINVTLDGEKQTTELTTNDYLMFNTSPLQAVPESDENLTYEMGFVVGAFLGDGSFGPEINGVIYDTNFSQNANKVNECIKNINLCAEQLEIEGRACLNEVYNNVYPVRISSKELVTFIQKWTLWERGTYAHNKRLNLNCLLQSYEFRKGILDGWYNTDGGNSNRCYTTSKELAENMELLITSLGKQSIINTSDRTNEKVIIRDEEYNRNFPLYCVRFYEEAPHRCNKDANHSWIKRNNSVYFRIKSIEKVDYSDSSYCIECKNQEEPYFTLPSGLITHNCRLKNELTENTFNPTSGLTGVMTGSCNVITLNINRIVQDFCWTFKFPWHREDIAWVHLTKLSKREFKEYLVNILERVYKYHIAYKTMLYDMENKGMFAASNGGYIHISKLYSTVGLNGLNEAAMFLGLEVGNNKDYIEFLQLVLSTVKEQNKLHSIQDKKRPFLFNSEVVPRLSGYVKPLVIDLKPLVIGQQGASREKSCAA